jgi:hypothetical protein
MTARDRRALVWGAVVLATAVVVLRVVPWAAREYTTLRSETREQLATLARGRLVAGTSVSIRDSLADVSSQLVAQAAKLVAGSTASEAMATLSASVQLAARTSGLRVDGLEPRLDTVTGLFSPVTVLGRFEGDVNGLATFLATMESGDPLLTVLHAMIQVGDRIPRAGAPEVLRAEIEVSGWRIAREES